MKFINLTIVISMMVILQSIIYTQQKKFIVGAYMHSTPWGVEPPDYQEKDSALFSLWRAKWMGINTAMVYVRQKLSDTNIHYVGTNTILETNMDTLRQFPNVIAMNHHSAYRLLDVIAPSTANRTIRNFDYIFFYTGAYYSKWDATRAKIPVGELGLKHDLGYDTTINGKRYWSSGNGDSSGLLIRGPNYFQETRYRSSAYPTIWDNEVQTYEVKFNMKLGEDPPTPQPDDNVCEIIVYVKYDSCGVRQRPIESKILKVRDFENPNNLKLWYNYSDFIQNAFTSAIDQKINTTISGNTSKRLIDVEFRVQYLNPNYELLVESIEVYDVDIWAKRLSEPSDIIIAKKNIVNYLTKFKTTNPEFYRNNLKYFLGVDEPHTVDAFIPHAFVQSVLDSLNNAWAEGAPQLFTHFFPEWSGQRDSADIIPPYVHTVKPKPFHFYYAPFFYKEKF